MRFNYSREDLREKGLGIFMIKTLRIEILMGMIMMMMAMIENSIKMQETNKMIQDNLIIRILIRIHIEETKCQDRAVIIQTIFRKRVDTTSY